jgi:MGT family glycosyltransferase
LTRLVLMAQVLRERGAAVAFAYRDPQDVLLQRAGFRTFPVTDADVTDFQSNVYAAFSPDLIEQCVKDELQAIAAFQPHAIIGDFRLTAAISARLAQIPYISVVNAVLTDYFDPVEALARPEPAGGQKKVATFAARAIQNKQKRSLAQHFRRVARRHKLKQLDSLYDFLAGDLNLITDIPQFCALNHPPAHYRYVGPFVWEGLHQQMPELVDVDPSRQLIYATTGNTGQAEMLKSVVSAFGGDDAFQVVLTTGAYIEPDRVPRAANVLVARFIPGGQIMPHARAVIHCGGSGSTYQTLAYGAPALVVPFNNEQRINGRLVQKHGVGKMLAVVQLSPARLRDAVAQLMADDTLQANVRQFQHMLQGIDAPRTAASEIEAFLDAHMRQVMRA